ncbi:MAG: hypothetical protein ACFFDX_13125 [Candidatus Odinarchaeota archaeon]
MPTFGHLFYGFAVVLPLLYFTKNKFSYKVAIIFFVNNLWGPDIVNLFFVTPFHSILGFLILAIPYSLVWTYASRFSLVRSEKGFPLKFEDSGIREVNWKNAYCVVAAAGFSHFFIDQFFHNELEMNLWSSMWGDIHIPHIDILGWTWVPQHTLSPLYLVGDAIVIFVLLLSFYFIRKGFKDTAKLFLIATGLSLVLMLISPLVYYGEREFAVLFEIALYIFLPLMLIMYVGRNVQDHPMETADVPKINRKTALRIVSLVSLIFAIFIILYALLAILMVDIVAGLYTDTPTADDMFTITIMGYYYLTVAVILFIGSIGTLFKVNFCRYMAIAASFYFIVFGFPIAIGFFLCEKEIKAMFKRE